MDETVDRARSIRKSAEHLQIRAAEITDAEGLAVLANLPGFRAGTMRLPFQSIEDTRRWLAKRESSVPNLVAIVNDVIVGNASLKRFEGRRQHAASFGIGVHDEFTGQGIGQALLKALIDVADDWLNITRLELTVYADNIPAVTLYRKFGFGEEGRLRAFAFRGGTYVDAYAMARIRRT